MSLRVALGIGISIVGAFGCAPSSPTETVGVVQAAAVSRPWELEQGFAPPDPAMSCSWCRFGNGVSLRGNTAVIASYPGAQTVSNSVYVYVRSGRTWSLQQTITGSDTVPGDDFGTSTALDDDTLVVGANQDNERRGAAYVFTRTGTTWKQQQKLTAPSPKVDERYGWSVAVSGDTALVRSANGVHVYVRTGSTWSLQQTLVDGGNLGYTLALEGNTALLSRAGSPQVYERSGNTWSPTQALTSSDGPLGNYGDVVALSGDTALVTAYSRPTSFRTGAAYVFTRSGGVWTEQQRLLGSDTDDGDSDYFGQTASLSGDIAIVGSFARSNQDGGAYIFQRSNGVWAETQMLTHPTGAKGTEFGGPSAIDGDRAIFAAWQDNDFHGGAFIYRTLIDGGKPCTSDADCVASAVCSADGVCCDSKCDGPCESCLASAKDSGDDGVCGSVPSGTDPNDDCTAGAGLCGAPGVCDGAGACESFAPEVTPCGDTICEDGVVKGFLCDGEGACVTSETECSPFACDGAACAEECSDGSQCAADMRCTAAHRCVPLQDDGTACRVGTVCKSGFCVDGVCCETECSGQCEACGEEDSLGTCVAVAGEPRGKREACAESFCEDGKITSITFCDGEATDHCTEPKTTDCDGYGCDESGCLEYCSEASPCSDGFICAGGGIGRGPAGDNGSCISPAESSKPMVGGAEDGPPEPMVGEAESAPPESGCSFRPGRPTAPSLPLVLLLGWAAAVRLRRRR